MSYKLIITDFNMPIMDGYEATKKIREVEANEERKIPIIAMTANAYRETKESCFEAGMDSFITKPVKLKDLLQVMEEVIVRQAG